MDQNRAKSLRPWLGRAFVSALVLYLLVLGAVVPLLQPPAPWWEKDLGPWRYMAFPRFDGV